MTTGAVVRRQPNMNLRRMEYKEQKPGGMTILGYSCSPPSVDRNSKKPVVRPVRQERLKDEIESSRFPRFLSSSGLGV